MILGHIELGDKDNDKLLNVAVGMISGRATTMNKDIRSSSVSFNAIPGYSSLDRKAMNGVQIPFTSEDVEW
jgi:carboxyl-terminal processing protease